MPIVRMDPNAQKEQYSSAYLRAVAAVAGFKVYTSDVDDDSIDFGIGQRGGGGTIRSPKIELQLKCTSAEVLNDGHAAFPLKIKNYNDLRHEDFQVPRILVVVVVPGDLEQWMVHSENSLALHHCGYWVSLRGMPATQNLETVTVHLPRTQCFDPPQLHAIMERVEGGGLP